MPLKNSTQNQSPNNKHFSSQVNFLNAWFISRRYITPTPLLSLKLIGSYYFRTKVKAKKTMKITEEKQTNGKLKWSAKQLKNLSSKPFKLVEEGKMSQMFIFNGLNLKQCFYSITKMSMKNLIVPKCFLTYELMWQHLIKQDAYENGNMKQNSSLQKRWCQPHFNWNAATM